MKRLFIALAMPEPAQIALAAAQDDLRESVPGAKWVDPHGAHITLKFLGQVSDETTGDIKAVIEEAVRGFSVYSYAVNGLGGFPTASRPRVVWAGIEDSGLTAELAGPIDRGMEWLGFKPETRQFHPHVTLARVKNPRRLADAKILETRGASLLVEDLTATEVTLFESRLTPKGAIYSVLDRVRLREENKP